MRFWFKKKQKTRRQLLTEATEAAAKERLAKFQLDYLLEKEGTTKEEQQQARARWFAAQDSLAEAVNRLSASLLR